MGKKIIKKEKRRYCVYVYLDTRKVGKYVYGDYKFLHEPIYVGKGARKRAYYHERENLFLKAILEKIGKPIILLISEGLTEGKAFELEIHLISIIGRRHLGKGPLCNLTIGGEGASGCIRSEETRRKISETKRRNMTEEIKRKISVAMKGRKMSEEWKRKISIFPRTPEWNRKISEAMRGPKEYRRSEEQKQHISEKIKAAWKRRREIIAAKASEMVPLLE